MTLSASSDNRLIRDESFEDLKDITTIEHDVIERAKQNNLEAINDIGCEYSSLDNHKKAIEWLGTSAAMGFHQSELELGHFFSKVDDPSKATALEWYNRASINGVSSAGFYSGMIMLGQRRYKEAMNYFKESAKNGDLNAQFRVALFHYNHWDLDNSSVCSVTGAGIAYFTTEDYKSAMEWFLKSAEQGHRVAAYYIGRMYENGKGVPVDYYQALDWYHKSKAGRCKPAADRIENLRERGYIHVPKC